MQSATGSYLGNGVDDRWINDVGFEPDLVVVKGDTTRIAAFRTSAHSGDDSSQFISGANIANQIQAFSSDSFQIGTNATVNSAAVTYYWFAAKIDGDHDLAVGTYEGNGDDDRNITGLGFTPTCVWVKVDAAANNNGCFRVDENANNNSCRFNTATNRANEIQDFVTDGFQVGTNARVNAVGETYYYVAFADIPGRIRTGMYTGDGVDDTQILTPFEPDFVLVCGDVVQNKYLRTDKMPDGESGSVNNTALQTNRIQSFGSNYFVIGDDNAVNQATIEYFWLAINNEGVAAEPLGLPTFFQSEELSIVAEDPLYFSDRTFSERLTTQIDGYNHELRAIGGYWSATISINDSQRRIEDWLENGLGRHIEVYNPSLVKIGEYFVNALSARLGPFQFDIGPLLGIGNRVSVTYSTVDTSVEPPALGERATTSVANNTTSQDRYGIVHKIYSINGATATDAEQLRDMLVNDPTRAFPATSRQSNLSGQAGPNVTLNCLGYWNWLKVYFYSNSATGDVNLSQKIEDVLGADPNGIFSTDYSKITTNTTQVGDYGSGERESEAILKDLNSRGDASDNPYTIGFYNDRVLYYEAVPTVIEYQQRITGNRGITNIVDSIIKPWDVLPAEYLFCPDFLVGRHPPITTETLGTDPRAGFIETVSFRAPYDLSVNGIKLSKVDQVLARRGIGGMA